MFTSQKVNLSISRKNNKIITVAAFLEGNTGPGIKFKETYIFLASGRKQKVRATTKNMKVCMTFKPGRRKGEKE